jgi:Antirepressor regulating drug resistance, predicted signal transduction N-terminal membrane component
MESFLYYLLRASIVMALFYGFYKLFFGRNTFHNVNRLLLLAVLLSVCALPLFRFTFFPFLEEGPLPIERTTMDISQFPVTEFSPSGPRMEIPWIQILTLVFATGFLFVFIRYLAGIFQLIRVIGPSEKHSLNNDSILCISDNDISPFSWRNYIVLSRKDFSSDNQTIIRHELAHVHFHHTLDITLFDLFTCLFWFNPFSWLLRREIQSVHEYQADERVLTQGIDAKQYQLLLIRKSVGERKFALANNFRQRDLHKRITMMIKNKTNSKLKWSYAIGIPMLALAVIVLSVPKLHATASEKETAEAVAGKIVVPEQSMGEVIDDQPEVLVSGLVTNKEGFISGVAVVIKETNRGTISDSQGKFMIKARKGDILTFSMMGYKPFEHKVEKAEDNLVVVLSRNDNVVVIGSGPMDSLQGVVKDLTIRTSGDKQPLYIVDGKIISGEEMQKMNHDDIESVSVLKDKTSTELYGEAGKNGTIFITTKKQKGQDNRSITIKELQGRLNRHSGGEIVLRDSTYSIGGGLINMPVEKRPLIVMDGKKMPKDFDINSIPVGEIESISILKDEMAASQYDEEGKNGVIMIMTKSKE